MNGRLEHGAMLAGILVLLLSLQFGACLGGAGAALPAALVLGIGVTWLWKHFSLPGESVWVQPVACAVAVLLSVASVEVAFTYSFAEWFCPLLAAVGSGGCLAVLRRTTARCGLCNRHLATQDVVFACPRCGMHVCDETCWSYEHRRCQLCLEQRVPVLPVAEKWWLRIAGPRAHHDRCGVCRGAADQVDLRNCPKCRRPQCRDCWDFSNGECQRCGAALPDIPASLSMVVAETPRRRNPTNLSIRENTMPKYQIYFDTVSGESRYNVDIDEGETLDMVLEEILFDLRERGDMLKGDGEPEVLWNGKSLDFASPLTGQGVRANDVLRVSTVATNG